VDRPQSLHEHSCHALIEARLLAADRLANEGDGHEDFSGGNVAARVPAVYRPGEERLERRFEPVRAWQSIVRTVSPQRAAAGREKDRPALPTFRRLQAEIERSRLTIGH
jgi:hypothetical protein